MIPGQVLSLKSNPTRITNILITVVMREEQVVISKPGITISLQQTAEEKTERKIKIDKVKDEGPGSKAKLELLSLLEVFNPELLSQE